MHGVGTAGHGFSVAGAPSAPRRVLGDCPASTLNTAVGREDKIGWLDVIVFKHARPRILAGFHGRDGFRHSALTRTTLTSPLSDAHGAPFTDGG